MQKFHKLFNHIMSLFIWELKNSSILIEGIVSLIIKVANNGFTFLMGILLVRFLGLEQYGIYSFALSISLLLYIPAEFGLPNLLVRETAKGIIRHEPGLVQGVWRWSLRITGLITVILVFLSLTLIYLLSNQIEPVDLKTCLWALALVPLMALIHLVSGALRGLKKVVLGQLPDQILLPGIFALILVVAATFFSHILSASIAMAMRVLSALIAVFFGIYFLYKMTPASIRTVPPTYSSQIWFGSSLLMALSSGLSVIKNRSSVILLGILASALYVGTYQVALQASLLANTVLQISTWSLAPRFASLYATGKHNELQKLVMLNIRTIFVFNFSIAIILVIFGKPLLAFFFGQEAVAAYLPLVVLLIGQMFTSMTGPVNFLLNMTGHEKYTIWGSGAGLAINLLMNLLLTPSMGVTGTALATSFSIAISQIYMWWSAKKRLGINSFIVNFK